MNRIKRSRIKWYRPMEIARLGLITNSLGNDATVDSNYTFILDEIKRGRLEARNYSEGTKLQRYLVSQEAIDKYHSMLMRESKK